MRRLLIALLLSFSLGGCAAWEVAEKPSTLAVCATADAVTTAYAVSSGLGHETNPLLAKAINAHHFFPLILSKLLTVGLIWWIYDNWPTQTAPAVGVISTVTCGVAINNGLVILKGL